MTEYELVTSKYLLRFVSHVKDYYSQETTVGRVTELKIIIHEEITVMRDIFGFTDDVIHDAYLRGRFSESKH